MASNAKEGRRIMSDYKCKCGNTSDFCIEHVLNQCGLYCGECGKWIKWLNKDEEQLFKHKQNKFFNFDAVLEIEKKKSYYEGQYHELMVIYQTMKDFIDINRKEYGGGCIEAYCDALSDLEDWLEARVKGQKNEIN